MATATLVDYSGPPALFGTPDLASPRRHSSNSTPALGTSPSASSGHEPSSPKDAGAHKRSFSGPFIPAASLPPASHGKLHKKAQHRKAPSYSHCSPADSSLSRTGTPPIAEHADTALEDPNLRSSKLRRNLKRLSQTPKDEPTSIDLSRTAEENEERSGIALSHPHISSHVSPRVSDVQFLRNSRGHGRSMSAASNKSAVSGSFTPSLPFMHPLRQQHDAPSAEHPESSSTLGHDHPLSGLGIDFEPSEQRHSFNSVRNASSTSLGRTAYSKPNRRSFRNNEVVDAPLLVSEHDTHASSVAPSYTYASSQVTPAKPPRSRRNTSVSQQSLETAPTPVSNRTSFSIERAASYLRTQQLSQCSSNDIDAAELGLEREKERAASIQAARRAFAEREEAKTRKYEKQERKAAERRQRKAVRAEDRRRRKSDVDETQHRPLAHQRSYSGGSRPSIRPRASTLPAELEPQSSRDAYADDSSDSDIEEEQETPWDSSALATPSESGAPLPHLHHHRKSSTLADPDEAAAQMEKIDSGVASFAIDPKISKKRQAKSGYLGFTTWFKTRMLHMSKSNGRGD